MPTYNRIKATIEGLIPPGASSNPTSDDFRRLFEKWVTLHNEADVATTAVMTESGQFRAERPCVVTAAYICCSAAITANDSNNVIFTASKRTVATPGTPVAFCTASTAITGGTGNVTAFLWTSLATFFDTDQTKRTLAAGDVLTLKVTKTGSITYPAGSVFGVIVTELSD